MKRIIFIKISLPAFIVCITSCAQFMSTEQKIKKFPPSYIAELCPKGYVMRVEQIKQECLEALTINVSTPELVKSYEAKMEQDAQRQAAVNAQATREAEERVKIEEALQKKEQEAENAYLYK